MRPDHILGAIGDRMFRRIIATSIIGVITVADATGCEMVTAQQLADALSRAPAFRADFNPAPWRQWA